MYDFIFYQPTFTVCTKKKISKFCVSQNILNHASLDDMTVIDHIIFISLISIISPGWSHYFVTAKKHKIQEGTELYFLIGPDCVSTFGS